MILLITYVNLGQSWGARLLFVSGHSTCKCSVLQQSSHARRKGYSQQTGWTRNDTHDGKTKCISGLKTFQLGGGTIATDIL